jgi:hypothetical protein
MVMVLAAVLYVLLLGVTNHVNSSPPLAANLLFSTPREGFAGPNHWYNFTVEVAGSGLVYGDLGFQLLNASGTIAHLPASSTLAVRGLGGQLLASYNWTSGTWNAGGMTAVTNQQVVQVFTGPLSVSGGRFVCVALSGFSGSISTFVS